MAYQPPKDIFDIHSADRIDIPNAESFGDGDEIADFLREGHTPLITEFIDQNRAQFQNFFNRALKQEIDLDTLIDGLDSENSDIVRQCRSVVSQSLDRYSNHLHKIFFEPPSFIEHLQDVAQNPTATSLNTSNVAVPQQRERQTPFDRQTFIRGGGATALLAAASFAGYMIYSAPADTTQNTTLPIGDAYSSATTIETTLDLPELEIEPTAHTPVNTTSVLPESEPIQTQEPLQQYDPEEAFDSANVDGLYLDTEGSIFYQNWNVPHNVYEANALTAQITGLDLSYTYAVQSLESSFNPNSFNSIDACGLGQFVPTTLAEKAYRFAGLFGYEGIQEQLIERFVSERDNENRPIYAYRFTSDQAEMTMQNLCMDPHFNTRLIAYMQMEDIGRMQHNLSEFSPQGMDHYPVTIVQAYTAHFAGRGAAQGMIENLHTQDGEGIAANFFSSRARNNATNQNLLYHTKIITNGDNEQVTVIDLQNPRTVSEFFAFLSEDKGLSDDILPDYTDRDNIVADIIANVDTLGIETTNIALVSAPLRSLRPQIREESASPEPPMS